MRPDGLETESAEISRGIALLAAFVGQLALVYLVPLIALTILSLRLRAPDSAFWMALDYVVVLGISLILALITSWLAPTGARSGAWIWTVPIALLALIVLSDVFLQHLETLGAIFWGSGEEGWISALVTLPASGCCWYSAVMAWRLKRHRSSTSEPIGAHG
jgi:hypothetical protein